MPSAPAPISSAADQPGQPYDATMPDGSMLGPWVKVSSGPADPVTGAVVGDFPSSPPWKQT
jgi:hypothetical protein